MKSRFLGILGENIACEFLENKGYKIIDRNYTSAFVTGASRQELDIVAQKNGTIHFVEVKSLARETEEINPEDRVDWQKQKKLIRLAQTWLSEKNLQEGTDWQIDVIAVIIDADKKAAKIRYLPDAVEA
jgi:putative endonuclease